MLLAFYAITKRQLPLRARPAPTFSRLPRLRTGIYDIGNKRADVADFPLVVHLVSNELEQVRMR